jgi:alkanesulfonate monooxygenase SsuD/methylene tetrahydromethanopterin reductase-like flavin-dependent oxidoreductase (luciferase family)
MSKEDRASSWATHPWVAQGAGSLRFGVQTSLASDWATTREFAQVAEQLGFDSLWIADHPLMGCDAWTTLAAVAAVTTSIRLGTLVSCASYKNPVVLARQVADVDRISGGRAILGLGSGDIKWEFEQQGYEWGTHAERHEALVDTLEVAPRLLRGEKVEHLGKRFRTQGATLNSAAIQQPRVPVLVAGGAERTTLRQVVEHADACNIGAATWAGGAFTDDDVRRKFDVLRGYCTAAVRPFESLLRTASVALYLGESEADLAARRSKLESGPGGKWLVDFLEEVPLFCTPRQAVGHFRRLNDLGFQYVTIIASPLDTRSLELLASQVIPEVLAPSRGQLS